MQGRKKGSPEGCICSESALNICCYFFHSWDLWVQRSRGGNGSGTPLYYSSDQLAKLMFPVCMALCSVDLEVLVPEGGMFLPGDTMILLNFKLRLLPGHFELLMPWSQQAKQRVMVLVGVINPKYKGKIRLLLYNGSREEYVGIQEIP